MKQRRHHTVPLATRTLLLVDQGVNIGLKREGVPGIEKLNDPRYLGTVPVEIEEPAEFQTDSLVTGKEEVVVGQRGRAPGRDVDGQIEYVCARGRRYCDVAGERRLILIVREIEGGVHVEGSDEGVGDDTAFAIRRQTSRDHTRVLSLGTFLVRHETSPDGVLNVASQRFMINSSHFEGLIRVSCC